MSLTPELKEQILSLYSRAYNASTVDEMAGVWRDHYALIDNIAPVPLINKDGQNSLIQLDNRVKSGGISEDQDAVHILDIVLLDSFNLSSEYQKQKQSKRLEEKQGQSIEDVFGGSANIDRKLRSGTRRAYEELPNSVLHHLFLRMHFYGMLSAFEEMLATKEKHFLPSFLSKKLDWWKNNKMPEITFPNNVASYGEHHPESYDSSSDLLIKRRDDGSIELNYPGLEPEIVDGASSPESLLARAVMRKAQATGGIIGANVITANTIEDKQRFFSEVDLDVLFRSFVAARDLDQITVNENMYANTQKIAPVKDENTAYASIKATDELDSSADYRWIEFMTQVFMSTKRGTTKSREYAESIGATQKKSTYSESWRNNMSQPKVRDRIFEIIHQNDLIPEFYFIINASDTHLKPAHQKQFKAWCERQGIDLDTLLNEYELEGIIQNPQPDSDLVADIDTPMSSVEPISLEPSNPYGYSEEEIELIAGFKSAYYESDNIGRYINYKTHAALFGYNNTPTSDVFNQMESGLEDIFSRMPEQTANPDFPDGNILGNLIYLIPKSEWSQKHVKTILTQTILRGLIAPFDDSKTDKNMRKLWGDALNASPEKFRNQFFQLLNEHELLFPFLAIARRDDAYVGEYATEMLLDWMRENEINPTKTMLDHQLSYPKDVDGQEVLTKFSNEDIIALDDRAKLNQELDDDLENSQDDKEHLATISALIKNPDVNPELIFALHKHADSITQTDGKIKDLERIEDEFDIDASLFYPEHESKGLRTKSDAVVRLKRLLSREAMDANHDATKLYNALIYTPSLGGCKNEDSGEKQTRATHRKVFADPRNVSLVQDAFKRLDEYGLLGMFEHFLDCDGDHKTALPTNIIKQKLETWKRLQADKSADVNVAIQIDQDIEPSFDVEEPIQSDTLTGKTVSDKFELDDTFKAKILEIAQASKTPHISGDFLVGGILTLLQEYEHSSLIGIAIPTEAIKVRPDRYEDALLLTKVIFVDSSKAAISITDGHKGTTATDSAKKKKSQMNRFFKSLSPQQFGKLLTRLNDYGLLNELKEAALSETTVLPRDLARRVARWQEFKEQQAVVKNTLPTLQDNQNQEADTKPVYNAPEKESDLYLNFEKNIGILNSPDGRDVYEEYRKRAIQKDNDKYAALSETDISKPYDAHDNAERDIPRIYVPGLLPEGNSDHEGGLELTGDFTGAGSRRGKRQVIIQEERRDLIVEALKINPQIDSTTVREYTHPEFDTAEGLYYTVIHAETYDGNWTQIAVSTAKGDGVFLDKHRQIVDPLTGRSRLGISDLREDLLIQRIKYAEDHPDSYKGRIDEISTMSPDDVPESTKTAIQWEKLRKYGNKVANQIHSSYAEHIRKFGEGVACEGKETSQLIIKTGDMRLDPNEEHPSLIYRTRWDRVVSAVREGKVTGLGHLACEDQGNTETARKQVEKGLLQWVIDNDPTNELFDCLRPDVQEWLCSDEDDMPQRPSEQPVNGHDTSSATVTAANDVLAGKEPANDDEMIELDGKQYPRSLLMRKLGL